MKKILLLSLLVMIMAMSTQAASLRQVSLEITDEYWQPVTNITQISVFDAGTSSASTIFSDRAGTIEMTNPITTGSTASTFDQGTGFVRWFQRAPDYKVSITDGTKTLTIDNRTGSVTRFPWFQNYIGESSSLQINDNDSLDVGTQDDMVLAWNNSGDFMSWIPAADGSAFNLGTSGSSKNVDFNVFVDTGLGLKLNEGAATLIIDGMTTSINTDSNFATNINTGTSTQNVSIGGTASGTIAIDTGAGITINADDSIAVTVSAGTIGLGATGGDITIDAVDKSLILRGSEVAANAILIDADNGSIDVDSADNVTIDAADDITYTTADGTYTVAAGGGTNGDIVLGAANDVDIDAADDVDIDTADGGITLTAAGGTLGDVTLVSADDTIITSSGKVTITNTEPVTISGALTVTGDTQLISVTRLDTPLETLVSAEDAEITDSGKVFIFNHTTEFAVTLPTVVSSSGVTFRFILRLAPDTGDFTVVTDSLEDKILGSITVDGTAVPADGPDDTITFPSGAAAIGDWVELVSDGTYWYISGQGEASGSIVPSKAD